MRHRWILVAVLIVLVLAGAAYAFLLPGISVARQDASPLETDIATWLLRHSVPDAAAQAVSPLGPRPSMADVRAGHDLFAQKCETCHAYDGGGKTELGAGTFPRPPVLHTLV